MLAPTLRTQPMSNERPIEPRPAADQSRPLEGHDFLDLEGELARRRGGATSPSPAEDCWALAGEEPAPPSVQPPALPDATPQADGEAQDVCAPEPEGAPPAELPAAQCSEPSMEACLPDAPEDPVPQASAQESPAQGGQSHEDQHEPQHEVVQQDSMPQDPMPQDEVWLLRSGDDEETPAPAPVEVSTPITLEASYCEPEPTSHVVSRAARRGLLTMGLAFVAIAGIQLSRQGVHLDDAVERRPAVELERSIHQETELAGPVATGRTEVASSRDRLDRPAAATTLRPAEPDELAVWETFAEEEESTDPFELEGPAASASFQPREDELALTRTEPAAPVKPVEPVEPAHGEQAREEAAIEADLQELVAAALEPAPLHVAGPDLLAELWLNAPMLGPLACATGPALGDAWTLRHPRLAPRRDPVVAGPPPSAWVAEARDPIDPLPPAPERLAAALPDWTVVEAEERSSGLASPGQIDASDLDPLACVSPHAEPSELVVDLVDVEVLVEQTPPGDAQQPGPLDGPAVALPVVIDPFSAEDFDEAGCWFLGEDLGPLAWVDPWPARSTKSTESLVEPVAGPPLAHDAPVTDAVVLEPVREPVFEPVAEAPPESGEAPTVADAESGPQPVEPSEVLAGPEQGAPAGPTVAEATVDPAPTTSGPAPEAQPAPARAGGLRRISRVDRWDSMEVPDEATLLGEARVLTPNVGSVRVDLDGGSSITGDLHAVGAGKVWLETATGRVSFETRRVTAVRLEGGRARSGSRVCVTTSGGVFVGELLAQEGDQVTLRTDDGMRLTLRSQDVRPETDQRQQVGIRRRGE